MIFYIFENYISKLNYTAHFKSIAQGTYPVNYILIYFALYLKPFYNSNFKSQVIVNYKYLHEKPRLFYIARLQELFLGILFLSLLTRENKYDEQYIKKMLKKLRHKKVQTDKGGKKRQNSAKPVSLILNNLS